MKMETKKKSQSQVSMHAVDSSCKEAALNGCSGHEPSLPGPHKFFTRTASAAESNITWQWNIEFRLLLLHLLPQFYYAKYQDHWVDLHLSTSLGRQLLLVLSLSTSISGADLQHPLPCNFGISLNSLRCRCAIFNPASFSYALKLFWTPKCGTWIDVSSF